MEARTLEFVSTAQQALGNRDLQEALGKIKGGWVAGRARAAGRLPEFEALRDLAAAIKDHSLAHLDLYLEAFEASVVERLMASFAAWGYERVKPPLLEFEDAVGYGTCGLIEAVRRYDPEKGTNFHAYAVRRIRGSMIDAFRRMDRLSRTMRQKAREVQRAESELEVILGRSPNDGEAAAHLGMTIDQFRDAWPEVELDLASGFSFAPLPALSRGENTGALTVVCIFMASIMSSLSPLETL